MFAKLAAAHRPGDAASGVPGSNTAGNSGTERGSIWSKLKTDVKTGVLPVELMTHKPRLIDEEAWNRLVMEFRFRTRDESWSERRHITLERLLESVNKRRHKDFAKLYATTKRAFGPKVTLSAVKAAMDEEEAEREREATAKEQAPQHGPDLEGHT